MPLPVIAAADNAAAGDGDEGLPEERAPGREEAPQDVLGPVLQPAIVR